MSEADSSIQKGSLRAQLRTLGRTYWIANWMELVERFAYYGVRTVLPVYLVLEIAKGGPEFTHVQKGSMYGIWALVQSFVPIFSGGFADRYGYKVNIVVATVLKILGYMMMAVAVPLATSLVLGLPTPTSRIRCSSRVRCYWHWVQRSSSRACRASLPIKCRKRPSRWAGGSSTRWSTSVASSAR